MKLSIYVDLRSIAWIVSNESTIQAKGIKRVDIDFDTYYEYIAGNPVSKRVTRRQKRSMRRNRWRRVSRREGLKTYLKKIDCLPDYELTRNEILKLRVKALSEKVTNKELGLIMLSLQKRRGYKNLRGVSMNEDSSYLAEIEKNETELQKYKSIADMLLTKDSSKNIIFKRSSYEKEFLDICKCQNIDDKRLYNLLYFQRSIKRKNVSKCKCEKNRTVCHYSHPLFQEFRIWRDVNNIEITDINFNKIHIEECQREKWVDFLMNGNDLTKAKCCKDLGIKKSSGYSWLSGTKIVGNIVKKHLGELNFELWQDLYSATDDDKLITLLSKKYLNADINKLIDIDFNAYGYTDFSIKAVSKLLPIMKQGKKLNEAIFDVYNEVDFSTDVSLRNYVLERHYNSYISLIDAIKKEYDITETGIEISRLLKAGNKTRKEIAKSERLRLKQDLQYTDYQNHLLRLHKEFNGKSPYEPNKIIEINDLFENYNIDHIVPKSKIFEHGQQNQCLCRKDLNEQKGSMTGLEYAKMLNIEESYTDVVNNAKISEKKRSFLMMEQKDIPDDYLSFVDYNTRCFLKHADYVIPNSIIRKYQKQWDLLQYSNKNDIRDTLMKCLVLSNFSKGSIDYFNNLKHLQNESIGRYNIQQQYYLDDEDVIPYMQTKKWYRKTKYGYIPRHQLHDETNYGKREENKRMPDGKIKTTTYYKVRKGVTGLSSPMIDKIVDKALKEIIKERFKDREHADVLSELKENPILFNGSPVKSVSIKQNYYDMIKLERGYVCTAINYAFNMDNRKGISLHDYIDCLNKKLPIAKNIIKGNDIVKYNGQYYYIVGITKDLQSMNLRNVFHLGTESIKFSNSRLKESEFVTVNQLGYVTEDTKRF